MRKILIIARREYLAAVRTKAFLIGLLSMPVMMFGSILVQTMLKDQVDLAYRSGIGRRRHPDHRHRPVLLLDGEPLGIDGVDGRTCHVDQRDVVATPREVAAEEAAHPLVEALERGPGHGRQRPDLVRRPWGGHVAHAATVRLLPDERLPVRGAHLASKTVTCPV